ncbi:MAG: UDP-N-acetylmuramate--alanine ligase [Burkholderiales bacterium]|nr:UDP-N-acetylmuramate--alanine ligase [Burkholderiales bacterium]
MSNGSRTGRNGRREIAAQAARLIAEGGLTDYGAAKRKAARQLGFRDSDALPDNAEVEAAVRSYQSVFQADEQRDRMEDMRATALEVMQDLALFNPLVSGGTWTGVATRGSRIDLDLFSDGEKPVEMVLLNRGLPYRTSLRKHFDPRMERQVTCFTTQVNGFEICLSVYAPNDLHLAGRTGTTGRAQRGNAADLRELMQPRPSSQDVELEKMLAKLAR